jgi:hypothetical protein
LQLLLVVVVVPSAMIGGWAFGYYVVGPMIYPRR